MLLLVLVLVFFSNHVVELSTVSVTFRHLRMSIDFHESWMDERMIPGRLTGTGISTDRYG